MFSVPLTLPSDAHHASAPLLGCTCRLKDEWGDAVGRTRYLEQLPATPLQTTDVKQQPKHMMHVDSSVHHAEDLLHHAAFLRRPHSILNPCRSGLLLGVAVGAQPAQAVRTPGVPCLCALQGIIACCVARRPTAGAAVGAQPAQGVRAHGVWPGGGRPVHARHAAGGAQMSRSSAWQKN